MPKSSQPNRSSAESDESMDTNLGTNVDDAIRALSLAARKPGAEIPFAELSLLDAWTDGLGGLLLACVEIQNGFLATAPALFESVAAAANSVFTAWTSMVHDQQAATLRTLRQTLATTEELFWPSA